ncbi:MAG: glycosyltransferase [Desulfovibrio sp.]|nr:glycosyltransferase [Desulfovibrio sp.]
MTSGPPRRVSLPDFSGRQCTLPDDPDAWQCEGSGMAILLLGLGPGSPWTLPFLANAPTVFWLDAPATLTALDRPERLVNMPSHWQRVTPEEAVRLSADCRRFFYAPGLRLAPDFWGSLLGRMDAALCAGQKSPCRAVLLPGSDAQLLHQELRIALEQCGFGPILEDVPCLAGRSRPGERNQTEDFLRRWRQLLTQGRPAFLLSVNLRGMDAQGRVFHLCQELGIAVAIWFVDNPWQVLSQLRLPWWKEAQLFVTDATFLPSLRSQGARRVFHLPLATAPHMWRTENRHATTSPLFVGRSAFPARERFFAAARVPQTLEEEAARTLAASSGPGDGPHFFWWHARMGGAFWPGHALRNPGLGAERCAQANRVRWLLAAGAGRAGGIRVLGDAGWHSLLPGVQILAPVDYYTALPNLYASAETVLNVTSLLLPGSLSQRHFDVWACGGLLLSDATQGLDIFPQELTEPIALRKPEDFSPRLEFLRSRPREARALRRAWREHLRTAHGYAQRVRHMTELLASECCNAPHYGHLFPGGRASADGVR